MQPRAWTRGHTPDSPPRPHRRHLWGVPAGALAVGELLEVEVPIAGYSPLASVAVWGPADLAALGRRYLGRQRLVTHVLPADAEDV